MLWSVCFLQVNRFSKVEDRAIFVTDRHLYKMDPTKQYKVMKTIPLYNVSVFLFSLSKGCFYMEMESGGKTIENYSMKILLFFLM